MLPVPATFQFVYCRESTDPQLFVFWTKVTAACLLAWNAVSPAKRIECSSRAVKRLPPVLSSRTYWPPAPGVVVMSMPPQSAAFHG